jgi:hypothetical protein
LTYNGAIKDIPTALPTNELFTTFSYDADEFGRLCVSSKTNPVCDLVYMQPTQKSGTLNIYMVNTN